MAVEGVTFATFGNDGTGFLGNARGTGPAVSRFVATAYRYEDLHVWQLAAALRDKVCDLTESGVASRDFDFRDQIRSSSSSAPANIAEGFGRFEPGEFAYFLRIARGSLLETRNHLQDARARKYFTETDIRDMLKLQVRATIAATRLLKDLKSCKRKDRPNRRRTPEPEPPEPNH